MGGELSLRLFGTLHATIDNQPMRGLHLREGERLLAYLVVRHGELVPYRQIAKQFWPAEASQAETYDSGGYPSTRQAIHSLRQALGDHAWRLVSAGKGVVELDLSGADVDLVRFVELVQSIDAASWTEAVALHKAPLLEGWNEKWVQDARLRCSRSLTRISSSTADHATTPIPSASSPNVERVSYREGESDGGAVPLNSDRYVSRQTDGEFGSALQRGASIVLVKGARQVGKTSLLARQLQVARENGCRVVLTDFQKFNSDQLATPDALYIALATTISMQLDLNTSPRKEWDPDHGPNMNFEWFLRRHVLKEIPGRIVWAMDEVDRLFGFPYTSEFFGLLRSWHNERSLDPGSPWSRVSLAIAYATEAHLFITDVNQSPFNVGTRLSLEDFTLAQLGELNAKYGTPLKDSSEVTRFHNLLGGQPYLSRRGLDALVSQDVDLTGLESTAADDDGLFSDHLRRLALSLSHSPELGEAVLQMLSGMPCPSPELFYRLRAAGIISGASSQIARLRCQLYSKYLADYLQ